MEKKDMVPIPIKEFLTGLTSPVNAYLRLSDSNFVLITKKGQKTSKDQLASYKDKEVQYLWVKKSEYHRVTEQALSIAGVALNKDNLDLKQKTQVVTAAAQTVFRQMDHMGFNEQMYQDAKQVTEATVGLVESHTNFAKLFQSLQNLNEGLLKHSVAVSAMAPLIARSMGWTHRATMEKLALGGLLHDIGKKNLSPELLDKPMAQMTFEEMKLYETHPFKGMEMAQSLGSVPDDIISMIYEHHENSIGQGYPQRIRDVKIHPLARVVALANEFINLTIQNANCPEPKSPREAIMYIENTMKQPYNKPAFRALKRLMEMEDDNDFAAS